MFNDSTGKKRRVAWISPTCYLDGWFHQLCGGSECFPALTVMGSKARYGQALNVIGLRRGCPPDAAFLNDLNSLALEYWLTVTRPDLCTAVAEQLRAWRDRDPFELWKELKAAAPPKPLIDRQAAYAWIQARQVSVIPVLIQDDTWKAQRDTGTSTITFAQEVSKTGLYRKRDAPSDVATRINRLAAVPWPEILEIRKSSAADIDPAAVAAWLFRAGNSFRSAGDSWKTIPKRTPNAKANITAERIAKRLEMFGSVPWPEDISISHCDADKLEPAPVPDDWIAVWAMDPPYQGVTQSGKKITGYGADLSRLELAHLAERARLTGIDHGNVIIMIAEHQPIAAALGAIHPELGRGIDVNISSLRTGSQRTFTAQGKDGLTHQASEWLYIYPPEAVVWMPPTQELEPSLARSKQPTTTREQRRPPKPADQTQQTLFRSDP